MSDWRGGALSERTHAAVAPALRLLVCPVCHEDLFWSDESAQCTSCGRSYEIADGIPILSSELQTSQGTDPASPKTSQVEFFDHHLEPEFEISRPRGTPRLHEWLLREKFRRSLVALEPVAAYGTALSVCGGSGLDSDLLAQRGLQVICSDLSFGAVHRARERARRYGLRITPVVADAEQLPFRDRSIPLVYVHDGLHHLENPLQGLDEMARVAQQAVSITEPAKALLTAFAVRLGIALETEEAGNVVGRLDVEELTRCLEAHGFEIGDAQRYAMFYRHEPGPITRCLSAPVALQLARAGLGALNIVVGDHGNKLTVKAERVGGAGV
jgi:SAM-dependent methyltransferase/uncharacterized protein YbaR (Trm112 family)